jgi:hypothetical protein
MPQAISGWVQKPSVRLLSTWTIGVTKTWTPLRHSGAYNPAADTFGDDNKGTCVSWGLLSSLTSIPPLLFILKSLVVDVAASFRTLTMEDLPIAFAIETLFRDAYRILEDIQSAAEIIEPIADTIASCHWIIQNLERVHRNQVRTHSPEVSQDIFDLRRNLDRFIGSCNTLTYTLSPLKNTDNVGCMFPSRQTWKRKQTRELQEEFWDHQRMLSLVLANAI